ncbi:D-alanyl-D-alanine carboxypeptidase [Fulvivirga lutimaris]|uniref:D-alanyl-D-alanine carboxypeptidase n=1 Tax=Fulvivirga lutimaris TaxID=1819566 RepID=UPI0012BC3FD2|nr:D-alanyl-D-alanine carboxypeptidase [Fulvivirga lutimaris]MTI39681.1 peptidase S13 [Fulvivirga lutimaris]
MKCIGAILILTLCSCGASRFYKEMDAMEQEFGHHAGLLVVDAETGKALISHNADKHFIPASNTKILTLFSSLKAIGDKIPALYYHEQGDSLIFWGSGDPSLFYKDLPESPAYDFLKTASKDLYFSDANFSGSHYGNGWAWDDYDYSYAVERSSLPLYGNYLKARKPETSTYLTVEPKFFKQYFWMGDSARESGISRLYENNAFVYTPAINKSVDRNVPVKSNPLITVGLLSDTLKRTVRYVDMPLANGYKTLYGLPADTLYKVMMQVSDNFIAEQLMITIAGLVSDSLDTDIGIDYIKENYFIAIPDMPRWVDGSGLSRYNLITPRSIVWLWKEILAMKEREALFPLLATGGESGTIKNYYKSDPPYIYGKTGTLSNNHCLSGYLITNKGKLLIFSFINNNYPTSSTPIKKKMEQILWEIHQKY